MALPMAPERCCKWGLQWCFLWRLNGAANDASNGAANGASNGASYGTWTVLQMVPRTTPKNGVSKGAWMAPEWWLRHTLNGAWTMPSMAPKTVPKVHLKCAWNGAPHRHWMALERPLNAYKKTYNIAFNTFFYYFIGPNSLLFPWPFVCVFKDCFWWKWNQNLALIPIVIQFWSPLSPTIETEHIYIYINPKNMPWSPDREWTNLSPFCFCFEQDMDLLRLWRAPPLSEFSLTMGAGKKRVCSYFKRMWWN